MPLGALSLFMASKYLSQSISEFLCSSTQHAPLSNDYKCSNVKTVIELHVC